MQVLARIGKTVEYLHLLNLHASGHFLIYAYIFFQQSSQSYKLNFDTLIFLRS